MRTLATIARPSRRGARLAAATALVLASGSVTSAASAAGRPITLTATQLEVSYTADGRPCSGRDTSRQVQLAQSGTQSVWFDPIACGASSFWQGVYFDVTCPVVRPCRLDGARAVTMLVGPDSYGTSEDPLTRPGSTLVRFEWGYQRVSGVIHLT